jgi:hypothetical protein
MELVSGRAYINNAYQAFEWVAYGIYKNIKNRGGNTGRYFTNEQVVNELNSSKYTVIVDNKMNLIEANFELK